MATAFARAPARPADECGSPLRPAGILARRSGSPVLCGPSGGHLTSEHLYLWTSHPHLSLSENSREIKLVHPHRKVGPPRTLCFPFCRNPGQGVFGLQHVERKFLSFPGWPFPGSQGGPFEGSRLIRPQPAVCIKAGCVHKGRVHKRPAVLLLPRARDLGTGPCPGLTRWEAGSGKDLEAWS